MSLAENLINLFQIDSQLRGLRSRLESAQRYLNAQDRMLVDLRQQREELEAKRRQIQATIGNFETETAALDERLEKLRNELNGATTNKQYTAVLTELNTAKLARSELEDRILQEMEQVENTTEQLQLVATETAEREKVKSVAETELQKRHDEVGQRVAELETEREAAASLVPAAELSVFNELAEAYEGEAMARIEEIDRRRREYACGSCNLHLPFEAVASLLGSHDTMMRCTACGRILYLHDETRGALAKK